MASVVVVTRDATACGDPPATRLLTDWVLLMPDTVTELVTPKAAGLLMIAVFVESNADRAPEVQGGPQV